MFQKYGTFNFGYQFWFLGLTIIMLKKISLSIFIIYISIIGPLFHFDYTNFIFLLVIKIINFNEIKNMAYLTMLVIFHVNMINCQKFNLPHIYCIFTEKNHFLK